MKNKQDLIFVVCISLIIISVLVWFPINHILISTGIKELKQTDNWKYYEKTKTSLIGKLDDFIESNKTNLENRVNNYFPFYQNLTRGFYNLVINTNKLFYKEDVPIGTNASNETVFFNTKYNFYYLKTNHQKIDLDNKVNNQIEFFNSLDNSLENISLNIYLVSRYEQLNLSDNNLSEYTKIFKDNLNEDINVSEVKINNYNDYLQKFYKTDHHWNMYGAYEGYQNIMNMLGKKPLDLNLVKVNKVPYYGATSKSSMSKLTYDDIYDVGVNLYYEVKVNGMDAPKKFKPRVITYDNGYDFYDYYIHYFNGQYGLVEYTYENDSNENLLIFSDSNAWQIDYLIASHYHKTYVINLRYDDYVSGKININDFIKENNISYVLFLYEGSSIIFDEYNYDFSGKIERK